MISSTLHLLDPLNGLPTTIHSGQGSSRVLLNIQLVKGCRPQVTEIEAFRRILPPLAPSS